MQPCTARPIPTVCTDPLATNLPHNGTSDHLSSYVGGAFGEGAGQSTSQDVVPALMISQVSDILELPKYQITLLFEDMRRRLAMNSDALKLDGLDAAFA